MREVKFGASKGSLAPATISPCLLRQKSNFCHSPALKPTLGLCYPWTKSELLHVECNNLKKLAPTSLSSLLSWLLWLVCPKDPKQTATADLCWSPEHEMPWQALFLDTPAPLIVPGKLILGNHSTVRHGWTPTHTCLKSLLWCLCH